MSEHLNYAKCEALWAQPRRKKPVKLALNTYLHRAQDGSCFFLRFHETNVLFYHRDGTVNYNCPTHLRSRTSQDRMNRFGAEGSFVRRNKHEWIVSISPYPSQWEWFFSGYSTDPSENSMRTVCAKDLEHGHKILSDWLAERGRTPLIFMDY